MSVEKEKKVKKEKRKRDDDKKDKKKSDKKSRRKEREELMKKVPKVDEHGIAYTKLQLRRMVKRVKRGLDPIETEQERQDRLRQDADLRKEEEAELAGMIYKKENKEDENDDDSDEGNENNDDDDDDQAENGVEGNNDNDDRDDNEDNDNDPDESDFNKGKREHQKKEQIELSKKESKSEPSKKKSRQTKAVPADYVCQACKNKHQPAHWIYDCPDKVTMRGTNQVSKKFRGLHDPDAKKVFVSGLPFDAKPKDVRIMFEACGKLASCRLITFEDTGRCKGQAFLAFESEEAAKKALAMNGTSIQNDGVSKNDDKEKNKKKQGTKRSLELRVTKVLNRYATKKTKK